MKPFNLNLAKPNLLKTQCLTYQGWTNANNGETFAVYNPFNQQKIAEVPSFNGEEWQKLSPNPPPPKNNGNTPPPQKNVVKFCINGRI